MTPTTRAVVIGAAVLLGLATLPAFASPGTADAPARATDPCARNLRRLAAAMRLYLRDWNDRFPPAAQWQTALQPYVKGADAWHCPRHRAQQGSTYAMNRLLGGRSIQDETLWGCVLLFESQRVGKNITDTGESLCTPGRHQGGHYYLLGNGRVVWSKRRLPFRPTLRAE